MLLVFLALWVLPARADFAAKTLEGCEKLTRKEWLKRYHDVELEVVEAFEKNSKLSEGSEREFFQVVYPQHLPETHPMYGAYLGCFTYFEDYESAKSLTESKEQREKLESCFARNYRKKQPAMISRYMDCLKKIKN